MARESLFESDLIEELKELFPGAIILKQNPLYLQGVPDRLILFNNKWAAFDAKADKSSPHRPNQDYYIRIMNKMSLAKFVYPQNKEAFINELQFAFRFERATRLLKR